MQLLSQPGKVNGVGLFTTTTRWRGLYDILLKHAFFLLPPLSFLYKKVKVGEACRFDPRLAKSKEQG